MKNIKTKLIVILLTGMCIFHHSCSDEDDPIVDINLSQVESQIQLKSWRITLFSDSGKDETDHFDGYSFTFEKEGKLISDNGTNRFEGSWHITDNNSSDDSPDDLELIIFFNLSNDLEELNEDWNFISTSDNKMELIHISGGNGGTDLLTFVAQ
jgi:mannosyltransferase OCH1-like enzyme